MHIPNVSIARARGTPLAIAAITMLAACVGVETDADIDESQYALNSGISCGDVSCLPTTFVSHGTVDVDDELGDVESELINGLAHNDSYWYWMNQSGIERVTKPHFVKSTSKAVGMPGRFESLGYDHFGDGDFYGGRLYVPITGSGNPVVVLAYNADLVLQAWATLPSGTSGGWVAVNPTDQRLYASNGFRNVYAFDMSTWQPASKSPANGGLLGASLGLVGKIPLTFRNSHDAAWWGECWIQGGAFSANGVFYYVLDQSVADHTAYSGVYAFDLTPFGPSEVPNGTTRIGLSAPQIAFSNPGSNGLINVAYDPDINGLDSRYDELEGIDVYVGSDGQTHIRLQRLRNEVDDDGVTVYDWSTNEPPSARVLYPPLNPVLF